jgi:RNA polymerase sigma-70 factor (ECF subfamily)
VGDEHESAAWARADEAQVREIRRAMLAAVRAVCPPWLQAQAEDITQRAMVKVLARRESNDPGALPRAYLRRVAHSALVDEIRQRRVRAHDNPDSRAVAHGVDLQGSPERVLELQRVGRDILGCLQHIVEPRRRAVTLHLQGFSRGEVAELLGCSQKRADNLTYRGLDDLRRCLRTKGHAP